MKQKIISQIIVPPVLRLLFCLLMLTTGKLNAQVTVDEPRLCGGVTIDTAALNRALEFEANNALLRGSSTYQIRVFFHILRNDDGTNAGATLAQINSEFAVLGYDYSLGNICFINCGYDYVNSSKLNTNFTVGVDNFNLFNSYLIPSCLNIFYPATILGNNGSCTSNCGIGGVTPSAPATFTLIARGNIGQGQTISHEVGHCLGLLHTFDPTNGIEDINGSNSASAGDQITDTHADPWCYNQLGNSCFVNSSGTYTGNCTDPNGQSNYSPPYTNLMAYWWASRPATELVTTNGQYTRANSYLGSNSGLQGCESSASAVTIPPLTISSGYDFLSSQTTMSSIYNLPVVFNGSAKALLMANTVTLQLGFNAAPGAGGRVDISVPNCSFAPAGPAGAPQGIIATGILSTGVGEEQIKVIPNPFNSSFELSATVNQDEKAAITIYDVVGARVKEVSEQNLIAGNNKISFDCNSLPGGIYFVEVRSDVTRNVIKIIKN